MIPSSIDESIPLMSFRIDVDRSSSEDRTEDRTETETTRFENYNTPHYLHVTATIPDGKQEDYKPETELQLLMQQFNDFTSSFGASLLAVDGELHHVSEGLSVMRDYLSSVLQQQPSIHQQLASVSAPSTVEASSAPPPEAVSSSTTITTAASLTQQNSDADHRHVDLLFLFGGSTIAVGASEELIPRCRR
jgi:hypothetical protein